MRAVAHFVIVCDQITMSKLKSNAFVPVGYQSFERIEVCIGLERCIFGNGVNEALQKYHLTSTLLKFNLETIPILVCLMEVEMCPRKGKHAKIMQTCF